MSPSEVLQNNGPLLPSGEKLGAFTLLKLVGKGSMGAVYTAWQEGLSRQVAVKVLMKDRFDQLVTADRFLQEAETAANLEHPNIVPVYGQGERSDCIWFAMQFLEGPSLAEWGRQRRRHPLPSRRQIALSEVKACLTFPDCLTGVLREMGPGLTPERAVLAWAVRRGDLWR